MAERFFSQRLTNKFNVCTDATYYLPKAGLDLWASSNSVGLTVLGSMYIFKDSATFLTAINDLWNDPGSQYWSPTHLTLNTVVQDMGKDLFIGIPAESCLARMRLIQIPTNADKLGRGGQVAYVFTQINSLDAGPDSAIGIPVGVVPC